MKLYSRDVLPFALAWRLVNAPSWAGCTAPWSAGPGAGVTPALCHVTQWAPGMLGKLITSFPGEGTASWRPRGWMSRSAGLNLPADHTHNPELPAIVQHILLHTSVRIHAAAHSIRQTLSSYPFFLIINQILKFLILHIITSDQRWVYVKFSIQWKVTTTLLSTAVPTVCWQSQNC